MQIHLGKNSTLTTVATGSYWTLCSAKSTVAEDRQFWFNLLKEPYYADEQVTNYFHESVRNAVKLKHPNILRVFESGREDEIHFARYEPFDGMSLGQILSQTQPLGMERILNIIFQVAMALQYAHLHGVLHGALCPENVLVDEKDKVKILNFEHAKLVNHLVHKKMDVHGVQLASYFSPEQAAKSNAVDGRSDIYSMGVLFYQMLTGQLPLTGDNLADMLQQRLHAIPRHPMFSNSQVPADIDAVAVKMLERLPEDRYPNISSFIHYVSPDKSVVQDEEEDYTQDIFFTRWSGLPSWLVKRIPKSFYLMSPTLVGSRRRLAVALLTISIIMILALGIVFIAGVGKDDKKLDTFLYYDWLAEEEAASHQLGKQTEEPVLSYSSDNDFVNIEVPSKIQDREQGAAPPPEIKKTPPKEQENVADGQGISKQKSEETQPPKQQATQKPIDVSTTEKAVKSSVFPSGGIRVLALSKSEPVADAVVYLDGEPGGQTGIGGELEIGKLDANRKHRVRVVKKGYELWSSAVSVPLNSVIELKVNLTLLEDIQKQIYFQKVAFADRLFIDGKDGHQLPTAVVLLFGKHRIEYVDSGTGYSLRKMITVSKDSPDEIFFELNQVGEGKITIVVKNAMEYGYAYVRIDGQARQGTTPMRVKMNAGPHRINITRDGFIAVPTDTTVLVKKGEETTISFLLLPE